METDVTGTIPKTAAKLSAMILAATALLAVVAGTAGAEVVYNNVPSSLPGNFASIGLAATSSSEFGGQVRLAGKARKHPTVTVVMSSWACQTGTVANNCMTTTAKRFVVPVTVRIYGAGPEELAELPFAEKTQNVYMKYRPSSTPRACADPTEWFDVATAECSHGLAFPITLTVPINKMPKNAIITVAYPTPPGPAESLNISVSEPAENTLSVGAHPVSEWVVNSTWSGMYGSTGTVGTLGLEGGLNSSEGEGIEYQPVIAINAE